MTTPSDLRKRRVADGALAVVTVFWGLTFPLIRSATQDLDPFVFVAARFCLAALAFLPLVLGSAEARRGIRDALLPAGAVGLLAWTSYQAQTLGLQAIPAGRAGFITGIAVILVPLMSPLFGAGRPARRDLLAAGLATAGMYLLTDPESGGFSRGDAWVLFSAVGYAAYIHLLSRVTSKGLNPTATAFVQVLAIAMCAGFALPIVDYAPPRWTQAAWIGIGFCAAFATVGTFWLQTRYQRDTTPQRAALIFSLEPVMAAGFAWLLLSEGMTPTGFAGAGLILVAVVGSELASTLGPSRRSRE